MDLLTKLTLFVGQLQALRVARFLELICILLELFLPFLVLLLTFSWDNCKHLNLRCKDLIYLIISLKPFKRWFSELELMWNNRSILFHQVCPQALLRGLSAVRLAQVAHVCFSPEYWEGRKSKKVGVWGEESRGMCRGEPAEYQPDIRIADQNPCSCKKIKTNNPPKLKIK